MRELLFLGIISILEPIYLENSGYMNLVACVCDKAIIGSSLAERAHLIGTSSGLVQCCDSCQCKTVHGCVIVIPIRGHSSYENTFYSLGHRALDRNKGDHFVLISVRGNCRLGARLKP